MDKYIILRHRQRQSGLPVESRAGNDRARIPQSRYKEITSLKRSYPLIFTFCHFAHLRILELRFNTPYIFWVSNYAFGCAFNNNYSAEMLRIPAEKGSCITYGSTPAMSSIAVRRKRVYGRARDPQSHLPQSEGKVCMAGFGPHEGIYFSEKKNCVWNLNDGKSVYSGRSRQIPNS